MDVLAEWRGIPGSIEEMIASGPLDEPYGPVELGMTRRVLVHHLAEAMVVAAGIVVAALGSPGSTFDWSWMMPFGPWVERLDYARKPIEPALRLLGALDAYVAAQIEPLPDGLTREVLLRDAPDADLRRVTVADVLCQEIEHAREHLTPIA